MDTQKLPKFKKGDKFRVRSFEESGIPTDLVFTFIGVQPSGTVEFVGITMPYTIFPEWIVHLTPLEKVML